MTHQPTLRVLIVEDHPSYVHLIRNMLRQGVSAPYVEQTYGRLSDVIELLDEEIFDIILLDLSLPDSTGIATVEKLLPAADGVPVIVLTGHDDDAVGRAAVHAGAEDFLVKDRTDAAALGRCIHYAIERRQRQVVERERDVLQLAVCGMEQMLGVVSHDLRAPLSAIRATTELLLHGLVKEEGQRIDFLGAMHRESLRMNDLLDNLLEGARLNSGQARWRWSTVNLLAVLSDAVGTIRAFAGAAPQITCAVDPPDLTIRGDRDGIRRLAINFLTNAVKHTPNGTISVTARDEGPDERGNRWVVLTFQDTGIGMPQEVVAKLGKPFALNTGPVGSSAGLGVAICRGIAGAHGGNITVQSAPGAGTTFSVRLRADLPVPVREEPAETSRS